VTSSAPPIAPVAPVGGYGGPDTSSSGAAAAGGSPRSGPPRSRYVDVFAQNGTSGVASAVVPPGGVNAFVPSAAPIGGFGGGAPAHGMSFFVPAPRAVEEEEDVAKDAPSELLRPELSETSNEVTKIADAPRDAQVSDAEPSVPVAQGSSTEPPVAEVVDEPLLAGEPPGEFGGASDWATDQGAGASDWAMEPEGAGARWDAPDVAYDEGGQAPAWESQTQDWSQQEGLAVTSDVDAQAFEDNTLSPEQLGDISKEFAPDVIPSVEAEPEGQQQSAPYENHEDYDYDPRWKWDEAKGEWYWDGGDEDENWIERATHDAAVAELQTAMDEKARLLNEVVASRDEMADELERARETVGELSAKVDELEGKLAERVDVSNAEAVSEAFERGKTQGYEEGYAAGSADAQEELADLLVCLGQEGRRVEKLRELLAETGADIDAIIAEFEAEEDEQIAALVGGGSNADVSIGPDDVDEFSLSPLREIPPSMKAMAAAIDTPERLRDFDVSSTLNADAEEFILPTPPKNTRARSGERNLEAAFELA